MYPNYLNDRQELGFLCIKDLNSVKQLSDFTNVLKNPKPWMIRKSNQIIICIISKEVVIALIIFLTPDSYPIESNVQPQSFTSSEVNQSVLIKSNHSAFSNYSPQRSDSILKLKGGSDQVSDAEQERLVKSVLSKAPESEYSEISINKLLQKIIDFIEPIVADNRLWRIFSEFEKPIKPILPVSSGVRSTEIIGSYENQAKTQSRSSSSLFAEALPMPSRSIRKLSPMQKRVQFKMAQQEQKFSSNLDASGLSKNHQQLSEEMQSLEKKTRLRRAQPLYSSQVLGDSF